MIMTSSKLARYTAGNQESGIQNRGHLPLNRQPAKICWQQPTTDLVAVVPDISHLYFLTNFYHLYAHTIYFLRGLSELVRET